MNSNTIISYLTDLENNNDREWYHAHKGEYRQASAEFEQLLGRLIEKISEYDSSVAMCIPRELTFKLVRDTRFSHDKSPYNPAFRAHISGAGKLPVPVGYYVFIKPGGSFLGGGLFADMFPEATAMVREYISGNGSEWEKIINSPEFSGIFRVKGNSLKNVPKGFERDHPQAEFLKFKSWYAEYPVPDEAFEDIEAFAAMAADIFRIIKPFNDYLNKALDGFAMPSR